MPIELHSMGLQHKMRYLHNLKESPHKMFINYERKE